MFKVPFTRGKTEEKVVGKFRRRIVNKNLNKSRVRQSESVVIIIIIYHIRASSRFVFQIQIRVLPDSRFDFFIPYTSKFYTLVDSEVRNKL